jgi:UDP-glucose:(heptosyl)LPS alpha-1,3-glucosyltransferase
MRIAFVRKAYTPYGGAERYLSRLMKRLCTMGHEVHVFAHRWETDQPGDTREGKEAPIFHQVPMISSPSFLAALTFARSARRLLEKEEFDLIHSFERTFYQDIYRAGDGCHREWLIRRRRLDPWIKRNTYALNPLHRSLLYLEKRTFQSPRLKKVIANSRRGKEEIIRHYRVAPEKIEVLYNGVDLENFHPRNITMFRRSMRKELRIPAEALVILFLGSGFRRKGLRGLLDSIPLVKKEVPQIILMVAGKGRFGEYQHRARMLGCERNVLFLGPTQRARELYGASDLFALPTIYEPFSNACLEAMATGIPVLTTSANGVAELIQDRKNGFIVQDPLSASEIGQGVVDFFFSPAKGAMGEGARQTALSLDLNAVLNRMVQIYEAFKE